MMQILPSTRCSYFHSCVIHRTPKVVTRLSLFIFKATPPTPGIVQVGVLREAVEDSRADFWIPELLYVFFPKIILNDRTIHVKHDFTWGVNVENAAHPCVGSPCAHGGSCRPRKEGYECDCPLGFEGLHCQKGTLCVCVCVCACTRAGELLPGAEGMDTLFGRLPLLKDQLITLRQPYCLFLLTMFNKHRLFNLMNLI